MSTKTTFKRIALVAVAATGFGLLSVVPSSATSQADTLTLSSATGSMTAGGTAATVTLTQAFTGILGDTMTVTASLSSAPTGNAVVPTMVGSVSANTSATATVAGLVGTTADTGSSTVYHAVAGVYTVSLPSGAIAGTYVIKFTAAVVAGGGTVNAPVATWTVTVAATVAATADTTSTALMASGGVTLPTTTTDAVAVSAPMATGTQAASILVTPKLASAAATVNISATITGPGLISIGAQAAAATGRSLSTSTAVATYYVNVWPDGTAGTSTITITSGGVTLGTKTVTFYGSLATITPTVVNAVIATTDSALSGAAITALAKDSNGNAVVGSTLYITSSDLTVVNASNLASTASDSTGKVTFALPVGLKAGSVTFTIGNLASASTITAVTTAVRVGSQTADSVTVIFDKNAYGVGEAATVTVALLDAAGMPVANGTYANVFTSAGLVSNYALTGVALPGASITTTGSTGTKTFAVSMPVFAADIVLTGTADTSLPLAKRVAVTSGTAVVSSPSNDAATDAANAATDAANYAADAADAATVAAEEATAAAQAAQESADAATAAVVELSTKTSALVDALRAQITGLGNYVAKVAAALGRIGTRQNQILYNQRN